ncbi:cytochrome C oxidase subunit IV family protein, partial [Flavobacteriaceae bacterium]|nr:cytochrome C oxidase subunit IV family protein [Flavobacteriaceae bacterium]
MKVWEAARRRICIFLLQRFSKSTIVKAYYITWDFMHMRDETKA